MKMKVKASGKSSDLITTSVYLLFRKPARLADRLTTLDKNTDDAIKIAKWTVNIFNANCEKRTEMIDEHWRVGTQSRRMCRFFNLIYDTLLCGGASLHVVYIYNKLHRLLLHVSSVPAGAPVWSVWKRAASPNLFEWDEKESLANQIV